MAKKVLLGLMVVAVLFSWQFAFCGEKELPQDKIIAIATQALKDSGIDTKDVKIVFDENGKLWCEESGFVGFEDKSMNHGILKRGFLKNYRIVYFDFKEPVKDMWVFVDKDTGEVLTYIKEQK
ncbi:MAG: hypothetical protein PHC54_07345 [Candidatus Omnitrophica bacterium]|nr:hypothetical protein [Candidatus Omnitrophota bacterium]MDD5593092.1 hypothetical protein [Candidatus Omnitrophota bacterium]